MSGYETVIAAVDLTPESAQVLAQARAQAGDGALHVVHAVHPVTQSYGGFGVAGMGGEFSAELAGLERRAVEEAGKRLEAIAAQWDVAEGACHAVVGNAASEIQRIASEVGARLIVVGSHGRHGLGLLLGSTANAVLHGAKLDVLAVRVAIEDE